MIVLVNGMQALLTFAYSNFNGCWMSNHYERRTLASASQKHLNVIGIAYLFDFDPYHSNQ